MYIVHYGNSSAKQEVSMQHGPCQKILAVSGAEERHMQLSTGAEK